MLDIKGSNAGEGWHVPTEGFQPRIHNYVELQITAAVISEKISIVANIIKMFAANWRIHSRFL